MSYNINEVQGTLNVGDSLNVARVTNLRGDLNVTGNLRVQGVCYLENVEAPSAGSGQPSAATLVEEVRLYAEKIGADIRRDYDWWFFPVNYDTPAVSTDGQNTVTFSKEGFTLCAGGEQYNIAPSGGAALSVTFAHGETGYLCLNIERLFKILPGQNISLNGVLEKVLNPSLVRSGAYIPIAFGRGGTFVRLLGIFADLYT